MATKPPTLKKIIQNQAYKIVFYQLLGVALLTLMILPIRGPIDSFSVFMGGMAYGLPNLFFVWRVFRFAGAQEIGPFMLAFFWGETLKLILSGILFLVIVKTLPVSLLFVLVGFVSAIVSFWIACMWLFSKQPEQRLVNGRNE